MNKLAATSLFIALSPLAAQADINMMEASFKTTFIDFQIEGLNLSRSYDSRSTHSGLFGFGWCSDLDTELIREDHSMQLRSCGVTREATGRLKPRFDSDSYLVMRPDGVTLRFALEDGRLTGLKKPGQSEVQIRIERDDSGRAKKIEARSKPLDLTYAAAPASAASAPPAFQTADFLYGPEGNLIEAKNSWSNTYRFGYDKLHNLTELNYPDGTQERLTYDEDYDRVTSFQGRNSLSGCKETYFHTIESKSPKKKQLSQISIATLTCPHQAPKETRFEFNFKKRQDNKWALSKFSLTRDGRTQSTQFKLGGLK